MQTLLVCIVVFIGGLEYIGKTESGVGPLIRAVGSVGEHDGRAREVESIEICALPGKCSRLDAAYRDLGVDVTVGCALKSPLDPRLCAGDIATQKEHVGELCRGGCEAVPSS